jgi:class 3 adenylate cyclase/tetratricopeptide (TPR) repeat protein
MATTNNEQVRQEIIKLERAIAGLEAQRQVMGDEVVETSLISLREKLANLSGVREPPQQQRKLATILFLDVVSSTRLGQHLEPDEVLELMDDALKRLAAPVEAHGGHVTRFQGDGFKAVFGLPVAHENDPEQAVRAGLDILAVAAEIAQELETERDISDFKVRVGVNTGLVASGGETEADDTVMGRAVNLAARLESAAPPGGLLISHHTYRHVRGVFDVDVLPPIRAKGFDEPVEVYLVKRAKPRSFRVLSRGVEGIETRMVGREAEMKYLQDALLTAVEEGEGQVVTITGEAGVGKSRLLFEFQNWIDFLPLRIKLYQGQARLEAEHVPYALLRDLFTFRFQIQDRDTPRVVWEKFERGVQAVYGNGKPAFSNLTTSVTEKNPLLTQERTDPQVHAHFIGQLLGFDFRDSPHLKGLLNDPQALHNRGLNSLREYFTAASLGSPVVVFLEDIHWADGSSLDVIKDLGKMTVDHPLLLVCLTRSSLFERRPYWGEGQEYHRKLELQPLSKRESRQLVEEILQNVEQVPVKLRELVVKGAEGNPFYIEELIKMLIERGVIHRSEITSQGLERWQIISERLEQVELPTTLMGVLQARLDSLDESEKQVIQQAAVVGRTFWDLVIEHIQANMNGRKNNNLLAVILNSLRHKELIFRREDASIEGAQEYTFKHDVLREVAYDTVLVKERKHYHALVAKWLIEKSGERMGEYLGLVAEHLEMAGRNAEAAHYYMSAGNQALSNYANVEAQGYYERALDLNPADELKLDLLTGLGRALHRQGMYERALEFWGQGIEISRKHAMLEKMVHLFTLAIRASNPVYPDQAMKLCRQALENEQSLDESSVLAHLLHQVGRTYLFNGLHHEALEYCRRALELGERLGDAAVQADTLVTMGTSPIVSAEHRLEYLNRAEKLAESQQLYYILGRARHNLAIFYTTMLGDYIASLDYSYKAAEVQRLRGDIEWEIAAIVGIAVSKSYLGDAKGALELLEVIEERSKSSPQLIWLRQMMLLCKGFTYILLGDWINAQESNWQGFETTRLADNPGKTTDFLVFSMLPGLLEIDRFFDKQDWKLIEPLVNEVIDHPGEENNSSLYSWMSAIFSRMGRLDEAESKLAAAEEQLKEFPNILNRWAYKRAKVELAVAIKDWRDALLWLEKLFDFATGCEFRWEMARTLLEWGDVYLSRGEVGDVEQARELYRQSLDIFTHMGADGYVRVVSERIDALDKD